MKLVNLLRCLAALLVWNSLSRGCLFAADPELETPDLPAVAQRQDVVKVGENLVVGKNEVRRDAVVIFGSAIIEGEVEHNLVVVGGNLTLNGTADRDVVVVLGGLRLGPQAVVGHNLTVIAGPIQASPGSKVDGESFHLGFGTQWLQFDWLRDWIAKGLFWARPMPHQLGWVWGVTLLVFGLYLFLALVFPRPIRACVEVLEARPLAAFFSGLLAYLVLGPVLLLLVVSVAGILVIPFLVCGLVVAFVFGKVAIYEFVGGQLGRQSGLAILERPAVGLVVGMTLFCALYMVPVLGFLVWGFAASLGLGAVLAAIVGFRRDSRRLVAAAGGGSVGVGTAAPAAGDPASGSPTLAWSDATLLPRAGFWIRFLATVVDLMILGILIGLLHLWPIFWVIYHVGMWAWKGTTIGGIVCGLKIVRLDGRPLDVPVVLVRCLAAFLSAIPLFLGFFWVGWDRECQSWHDKIAGTVIVKAPKGMSLI